MRAPPAPRNEPIRLEALRELQILDTEDEAELDALTHTAADLFGAPISLISLVDADRQWFKSCLGLGERQTTRAVSFCGHAVAQDDDVFIVPDARRDERFHDNPLVTGAPHIVSYVGARLVTIDGHALGTICVISPEPLEIHDAQVHALLMLRDQAMRHLSLRQKARSAEQRMDDAGLRISVVQDHMGRLQSELGTTLYGGGSEEQVRRRLKEEIQHMQDVLDDWAQPLRKDPWLHR